MKKSRKRSRAYYRHHRRRVIQRKNKIAKQLGWNERYAGKFAKGKVHCSCYYCRKKTKYLGLPKSDLVRMQRMDNLDDWV
ncbi:hypothetical protein J2TS4_27230 [Paenibacillus sp. J2TS4]|nr:hypothetical protein J2TS4_27230 [Paenibacillus sp. J2TS4]